MLVMILVRVKFYITVKFLLTILHAIPRTWIVKINYEALVCGQQNMVRMETYRYRQQNDNSNVLIDEAWVQVMFGYEAPKKVLPAPYISIILLASSYFQIIRTYDISIVLAIRQVTSNDN